MSASLTEENKAEGVPATGEGAILKRLELQGFKSFADPTVLEFGPGLSAVVGPNGSGKSNLSEAFRWVLGEHSARQLRGSRMEDIIFAGSSTRRPVGLAQVSIVLDNDGSLDVPFNEVSITRRVDRSGQSQFLLNGSPCRLKDIQQLLHDTGLGREAYSVVGQGQIDQVLSDRSEDRRVLVDEVAGIVRFKARRTEALRRLDRIEHRLERLADILNELQNRIEPLRSQAEEARRYRDLQSQLTELEIRIRFSHWTRLQKEAHRQQEKKAAAQQHLRRLQTELTAVEEKVQAGRRQESQREEEEVQLQTQLDHLAPELEEARSAVRLGQAKSEHLRSEIQRLSQSQAELSQQLKDLAQRDQVDQAQAADLADRYRAKEAQLASTEADLTAWRQAQEEQQQVLAAAQREEMELLQREGAIGGTLASLAVRRDEGRRRLAEAEDQHQQATRLVKSLGQAYEKHRDELQAAKVAEEQSARVQTQLAAKLKGLQGDLDRANELRQQAEQQLAASRSRQKVLSDLQRSYEGYGQGVRAVMAGKGRGNPAFADIVGTVAELLTIPAQYEAALEAALGSAAQNVVVKTAAGAQRAVEELRRQKAGRATFLPLDALAARQPAARHRALAERKGIVDWAIRLVSFAPPYERAMIHVLGRTLVAEDLTAARAAARQGEFRFRIVTLAGDLVHAGGAISGGSRHGSSRRSELLARRRVLAEIKALAARQGEQLAAAKKEGQRLRQKRDQAAANLEEAVNLHGQNRQVVADLSRELKDLASRCQRAEQEVKTQAAAVERLAAEEIDIGQEAQRAEAQAAAISGAKKAVRQRLAAARENMAASQLQGERIQSLYNEQRLELERLRQALDSLKTLQRRAQRERQSLQATLTQQQRRQKELAEEAGQVIAELKAGRQLVGQLTEKQGVLRGGLTEARQARQSLASQVQNWEKELFRRRTAVDQAREELHQLEVEASRLVARQEQAQADLEQYVDPVGQTEPMQDPLTQEELQQAKKQLRRLQSQLRHMGDVNLAAEAQLSQLVGREAFLSHQMEDLTEAAGGLRTAIGLLEERMEVLFLKAFAELRQQFSRVFQKLFGGGRADLTLHTAPLAKSSSASADGNDGSLGDSLADAAAQAAEVGVLASGLEIVAQPPGKRLQPLPLLSGGERALTAIALLFALLEVRPTPFCVLDEIDTALDEVNQRRFANYLAKLSEKVQFIVITHRKITMAQADYLYGVSMGEAGVSRLVTVKMADTAANAKVQEG